MIEKLFDLAGNIIPPADSDPAHVYRYRLSLSIWILAMTIAGGLHIAMACGYMVMFFPGFATAETYGQQQQLIVSQNVRLDRIELAELGAQMFTLREKQCKAEPGSKDVYTTQLNGLWAAYMQLSKGQIYRLPGCEEF